MNPIKFIQLLFFSDIETRKHLGNFVAISKDGSLCSEKLTDNNSVKYNCLLNEYNKMNDYTFAQLPARLIYSILEWRHDYR